VKKVLATEPSTHGGEAEVGLPGGQGSF